MRFSWTRAASELRTIVADDALGQLAEQHLDDGQRASLMWMAERLPQTGVVLADEVGTGKTRIACAVVLAVVKAGGRAAVVVPTNFCVRFSPSNGSCPARTRNRMTPSEYTSVR